tara:strand:+ start:7022 stop:7828 length:807 start_codon:yes stop_codon:yes gene_type:complete
MKVIVSHDIDHHRVSDHFFKDLYLQKYLIKNLVFLLKGKLSFKTWKRRMSLFKRNSMGYIDELIAFNEKHGVESTFFTGFDNALNLSYDKEVAKDFTKKLSARNHHIYPHGIAFNEKSRMKKELDLWKSALENPKQLSGIRMHYLRSADCTDGICSELGYDFVSNRYSLGDPYQSSGLIHFPVALMDVYAMTYAEEDPSKAIEESITVIDKAQANGQKYFTIIFHDHHYCDVFKQHKEWYEEVIKYIESKFEFTTFVKALKEIKSEKK